MIVFRWEAHPSEGSNNLECHATTNDDISISIQSAEMRCDSSSEMVTMICVPKPPSLSPSGVRSTFKTKHGKAPCKMVRSTTDRTSPNIIVSCINLLPRCVMQNVPLCPVHIPSGGTATPQPPMNCFPIKGVSGCYVGDLIYGCIPNREGMARTLFCLTNLCHHYVMVLLLHFIFYTRAA